MAQQVRPKSVSAGIPYASAPSLYASYAQMASQELLGRVKNFLDQSSLLICDTKIFGGRHSLADRLLMHHCAWRTSGIPYLVSQLPDQQ
jgi:hypothetical protein